MILLSREGRIRQMTEPARRWVAKYFGKFPRSGRRLPEDLWRWVQGQYALLAQDDEVPSPRGPLMVEHEGKRLVVRLFADLSEGQHLLLLEEVQTALSAASMESLGLARREAEVLFWVTQGKTNGEVGAILGMGDRTVQTHLERIYQKLDVHTRTAAIMRALETLNLLKR